MRRWQVLQRLHTFKIGDVIDEFSDGFKAIERWIPSFVRDNFLNPIFQDKEIEKIGSKDKEVPVYEELDLNRDGKVNKKDLSLAGKVMGKARSIKKSFKNKGGGKKK